MWIVGGLLLVLVAVGSVLEGAWSVRSDVPPRDEPSAMPEEPARPTPGEATCSDEPDRAVKRYHSRHTIVRDDGTVTREDLCYEVKLPER